MAKDRRGEVEAKIVGQAQRSACEHQQIFAFKGFGLFGHGGRSGRVASAVRPVQHPLAAGG